MSDQTAVMLGISMIVIVGILFLGYFWFLIQYCENDGDPTDPKSACYDPHKFCEEKCASYGDVYKGNFTKYTCLCHNGEYSQDPRITESSKYFPYITSEKTLTFINKT
jgi:hypothetical protein